MNADQMTMSDGYIGSMGINWETPTQNKLEQAIAQAIEIEQKTREEIITMLESGQPVRWCKSPNFCYDHSFGIIRMKRTPKPIDMVLCDCGHEVARVHVMRASLGTSCPDCYDRMSD